MAFRRATTLQYTAVGKEATEGTAVAALTRFTKTGIDIQPDINFELLRTMGFSIGTDLRKGKNSTTGAISGNPAYDELTYFYNGLLHVAEPTTPGGGTNAREWAFTPLSDAAQAVNSFTVKRGSPQSLAEMAAGMRVVSYGMTYDTDKVEHTGAMLGRGFQVSQQMSTNEQQTITASGTVSGGTYTITIVNPRTGISKTTAAIAYDANNAAILAALELLSNVEAGDLVLTGGPLPGAPLTIEFRGQFGAINVATLVIGNGSITGGGTYAVTSPVPGVPPADTSGIQILPEHVKIYVDTTSGGLGGTKLTDCFAAGFQINNVFSGVYVLDADNDGSLAGLVNQFIDGTVSLRVEANAQGMTLYNNAIALDSLFMRFEAEGPLVEAGQSYLARHDFHVKLMPRPFQDEGGVYCIQFDGHMLHNAAWGKFANILLRNGLTAV